MTNKSIDINQRIPLDILQASLEAYLSGTYSNDYIMEQLRLEFEGENRLKKSLRIVNKIIQRNPLVGIIDERKLEIQRALRNKTDRNIILISLLNSAFPFSQDVLQVFGKYFKVQDKISADIIKKTISGTYGGNRATENGMYSVIPMFLEAGFFDRRTPGIYEFNSKLVTSNPIAIDLYKKSFKSNFSEEVNDYELMDPYFQFIQI